MLLTVPMLTRTVATLQQAAANEGAAGGGFITIIYLLVVAVEIAALWRIFAKAGQPGWAAIVPIYNLITLLRIVNRPLWWIALLFVPIANIVIFFMLGRDLARAFGKGLGFAFGLFFLGFIFYPILGFGSSRYLLGGNQAGSAAEGYPQDRAA